MSLLHTAVGIFTIANPIGNLPIYLSFTDGNKRKDRAIASSAAFTFLIALLLLPPWMISASTCAAVNT